MIDVRFDLAADPLVQRFAAPANLSVSSQHQTPLVDTNSSYFANSQILSHDGLETGSSFDVQLPFLKSRPSKLHRLRTIVHSTVTEDDGVTEGMIQRGYRTVFLGRLVSFYLWLATVNTILWFVNAFFLSALILLERKLATFFRIPETLAKRDSVYIFRPEVQEKPLADHCLCRAGREVLVFSSRVWL